MKNILDKDIRKIIDFIVNHTTEPNYGLVASKYFNAVTGELIDPWCDFDDIGDYLIYIAWHAKVSNNNKMLLWCKNQIEVWDKFFKTSKGFYLDNYNVKINNKVHKFSPIFLYNHQDAFLGLRILYEITGDRFYLNKLEDLVNSTFNYAMNKKHILKGRFLPYVKIPLPKFERNMRTIMSSICSKPAVDGLILEETIALYTITKNNRYLKYAKKLAYGWLSFKFFKKHHLFADNIFPIINRPVIPRSSVTKANTNMLHGLISLWKVTNDDILKGDIFLALDSLKHMQLDNGAFYRSINYIKNIPYNNDFLLTNNHALIALYLEAYITFKNKEYLRVSQRCADYWLSLQNKYTGLIQQNNKNKNVDLDSEADVFTEFLKLYEITGDKKYLESVKKGTQGISKYFSTPISFVNHVDSDTGEQKLVKNEVKFLGGYLRLLLYLRSFLAHKLAKDDPLIWQLIRDR